MEDEEYQEIFAGLSAQLQSRVTTLMKNYKVDPEKFSDLYRTYEYNLGKNRENNDKNKSTLEFDIIQSIEDEMAKQGQEKG
mgnify:FL=1|jgi:hypothetical protein